MRKPVGFQTRPDTNGAVQPQKMAIGFKFRNLEVEELYYLCSENKGADQMGSYRQQICTFVFTYTKSRFSHDAAHYTYGLLSIHPHFEG